MRQWELIERVKAYDPTADEGLLNRAYVYAVKMHGAQLRASGDPYFAHPIEVAGILTEYRMDAPTIVTALLHDIIEDTEVSRAELAANFGEEVATLVEGVTKLSKLEFSHEAKRQGENLRKFIVAISRDVRVLMVKLADRLHNMRTLHHIKSPAKRERIARETLDIYAPLARSIGVHRITSELEELAFEHLNPTARAAIVRRLKALKEEQGKAIGEMSADITESLSEAGIPAVVSGREKKPYSIWRKLQRKSVGFAAVSDIYAFRVVVESEDDCYRALGVIHRTWPTVPSRFKDYLSTPKRNNYRSLHTTVVGPRGMRVEVQIRTAAMDRVAEEGVAAHWRYKTGAYGFDKEGAAAQGGVDPLQNLRHLVQMLEHGGDSEDIVEHAKLEMFLDQVFVFTPKGRLISLPQGAMPLDFAYAVHTDVGDTAVGVKINGELRALRTPLTNGDVVEVVRGAKGAAPPPDWQSLTVTGRARSAIRRHLRVAEREEFTRLGRAAVEQAFARAGKSLADTSLRAALERFSAASDEEMFDMVGRGRVAAAAVVGEVFPGLKESERAAAAARVRIEDGRQARLYVRGSGTAGLALHFGDCCRPVPGDRIVGIVQPGGEVMTVHAIDCARLAEWEDVEGAWRDLHWTPEAERSTVSRTRLAATVIDAPGALGIICTSIGEAGGNIANLRMTHRHSDFFDVEFELDVVDAKHLANISAALRACPEVETVERIRA